MKPDKFILLILLTISAVAHSQTDYLIDWNVSGQSFTEFVNRTEAAHGVRFFYNEEWIRDIKLGEYGQNRKLTEILDTLFRGRSIYYYVEGSGNIILTKYYAIKSTRTKQVENQSFIPGIDYGESDNGKTATGNLVVEIGNPADRNLTGNVTITGIYPNQQYMAKLAVLIDPL